MIVKWDTTRDSPCPDCGHKEDAVHVLMCSNQDRAPLMKEQAEDVEHWIPSHNAHKGLAYWIPKRVMLQTMWWLTSYEQFMYNKTQRVAKDNNNIGWRNSWKGRYLAPSFIFRLRHFMVSIGLHPLSFGQDSF